MISLFAYSKIAFRLCRQRWQWWWNRDRINQLQDDVWLALRDGQIAIAVLLLEEQLQSFQWPFQIESLLFKRDSRPESLSVTLELLECLWRSKLLLAHQSFYAGIAMAHSALLAGDDVRLGVLRPWLESAAALDVLNLSFKSERLVRNRESPFKQCVSARCCLLQCCFAEKSPDKACIDAIGRANLATLPTRLSPPLTMPPTTLPTPPTTLRTTPVMPLTTLPICYASELNSYGPNIPQASRSSTPDLRKFTNS